MRVSALVRVRDKIKEGPDARIAVAMPPRIGTNNMMVMREGIVITIRASRHPEFDARPVVGSLPFFKSIKNIKKILNRYA